VKEGAEPVKDSKAYFQLEKRRRLGLSRNSNSRERERERERACGVNVKEWSPGFHVCSNKNFHSQTATHSMMMKEGRSGFHFLRERKCALKMRRGKKTETEYFLRS
jgi:hypothetical protein